MTLNSNQLQRLKANDIRDAIRRAKSLRLYLNDVVKKVEKVKIERIRKKIKDI